MYKIEKNVVLDERVDGALPRDIVLVDAQTEHALQQTYHIMSIGHKDGKSVFNYSTEVIKALKLMGIEEEQNV